LSIKPCKTSRNRPKTRGYGNTLSGCEKAAQDLEAGFLSQTVKRVERAHNTGGKPPFLTETCRKGSSHTPGNNLPTTLRETAKSAHPATRTVYRPGSTVTPTLACTHRAGGITYKEGPGRHIQGREAYPGCTRVGISPFLGSWEAILRVLGGYNGPFLGSWEAIMGHFSLFLRGKGAKTCSNLPVSERKRS